MSAHLSAFRYRRIGAIQQTMTEIWRAVDEWVGYYEVSSLGRVRSLDRECIVVNRFGNDERRRHRGKILTASPGKSGYPMVSFTRPGGYREYRYLHELVTTAFHGPRPAGLEVCHKDGVRSNCAEANLRWGTRSSNALDRHAHETMNQARGEVHAHAKLTEDAVRFIRKYPSRSSRDLGRKFGVSHGTILNARKGVQWKHID